MQRRRSQTLSRLSLAAALLLAGAGIWGCEETVGFARVERVSETVARFERQTLEGRRRIETRADVTSVTHPELLINWTNINREVEVEVYVVRLEDYKPNVPLADLPSFWSSVPEEGPNFGERRPTLIHLHPEPGAWMVIFYNPNIVSPATRALLSATVEYSYYTHI